MLVAQGSRIPIAAARSLFRGLTPAKGSKGCASASPRPEPAQLGFFRRASAAIDSAVDARATFSDAEPLFGGGVLRHR